MRRREEGERELGASLEGTRARRVGERLPLIDWCLSGRREGEGERRFLGEFVRSMGSAGALEVDAFAAGASPDLLIFLKDRFLYVFDRFFWYVGSSSSGV